MPFSRHRCLHRCACAGRRCRCQAPADGIGLQPLTQATPAWCNQEHTASSSQASLALTPMLQQTHTSQHISAAQPATGRSLGCCMPSNCIAQFSSQILRVSRRPSPPNHILKPDKTDSIHHSPQQRFVWLQQLSLPAAQAAQAHQARPAGTTACCCCCRLDIGDSTGL